MSSKNSGNLTTDKKFHFIRIICYVCTYECFFFSQKVNEMEKLLKDSERTLIEREKLISELRLRMPATTDRDTIIERATSKVSEAMSKTAEPDYETQQGMKIAQSTVHSLQVLTNA